MKKKSPVLGSRRQYKINFAPKVKFRILSKHIRPTLHHITSVVERLVWNAWNIHTCGGERWKRSPVVQMPRDPV